MVKVVQASYFNNMTKVVKNFFFPSAKNEKLLRFKQLKDVSIWFVSIVLMSIFEKRIVNALSVDTDEVQKMSQQLQRPPAY